MLEPGSVDMILGVQWLRKLGHCEIDWAKKEWMFVLNGQPVMLCGELELHPRCQSIDLWSSELKLLQLDANDATSVVIPQVLSDILASFSQVFA